MKFPRLNRAFTLTVIVASLSGVGVAAASAADPTPNGGAAPAVQSVVNISRSTNVVNFANRLVYCGVGTSGSTCTISSGQSATRSIGLALGVTRGFVAGQISISADSTLSVSVACTSPALLVGQKWSAYPYGTRISYQIRQIQQFTPTITSGTLYAFNPNGAIYCRQE